MKHVGTQSTYAKGAPDLTVFTHSALTVVFVLLVVFMTVPSPHQGTSIDLPKVNHPTPMPRVQRKDALVIAILRTGDVFFGNDKLPVDSLAAALRQQPSSGKKLYIRADARVPWSTVALVVDQARAAGTRNLAFLADQRKAPSQ